MDPVTGTILGDIGGALVSGIFGSQANAAANASNARINEQNIALQREFAQKGIQWRVEDAKAAGVHPVYALGAAGASYNPGTIAIQPNNAWAQAFQGMGQDIGHALSRMETPEQRAVRLAQLTESAARVDASTAEATLARARARKLLHDMEGNPGVGVGEVGLEGVGGAISYPVREPGPDSSRALPTAGHVRLKASDQTSESRFDRSRVAGVEPAWQGYRLADGSYAYFPSEKLSNAWQDMPLIGQALVAYKNAQRYLEKWLPHVYVQHGGRGKLPKYWGRNSYDPMFGGQ